MKKLTAVLMIGVIVTWATVASAASYAALDNDPYNRAWVGMGGMYISGDNGQSPSVSDSEFVPTVNLVGVSKMLAYQVFYGMGSDSTVYGGNLDYILANNFDQCFTCPGSGQWWFGAGASVMVASDLYFDAATPTAALDDTFYGANVGFGYIWSDWSLNLYAHYLQDQFAFQGMLLYNITK